MSTTLLTDMSVSIMVGGQWDVSLGRLGSGVVYSSCAGFTWPAVMGPHVILSHGAPDSNQVVERTLSTVTRENW